MSSRGTKSPSPGRGYRKCRLSPRRRSRSPIRQHSPSSRVRRRSLSKGSRDAEHQARSRDRRSPNHSPGNHLRSSSPRVMSSINIDAEVEKTSNCGRHDPGPNEPLPSDIELKKIQISVRNPSADPSAPYNGTINLQIEDVKIPRRKGEGSTPLFGALSPPARLVVLVDQSVPAVKQEPLSPSRSRHARDHNVSETGDSRISSSAHREHSSSSYRYIHSRANEPGHSRLDWERERGYDSDRTRERNDERDSRRGDFHERTRRRDDRDRISPRSKERERERHYSRDEVKERDKSRDMESDKAQSKDTVKDKPRDKLETTKASVSTEETNSSTEANRGTLQIRSPPQFMNRMPRPRAPMYPPMGPPPFLPRGPLPPHFMRGMPPPHMFGPPPFIPPRMMGPRPRF